MDQVFYGVLTSAIVGILSWGGGRFLSRVSHRQAGASLASPPPYSPYQPYQAYPGFTPAPQPSRAAVNPSKVLFHMALLQFIVNLLGFVIGFLVGAVGVSAGASPQQLQGVAELLILFFGTLTAIVFFFVIGLRLDPAIRWRHLTYVALGTVVLTLIVNFVVALLLNEVSAVYSSPAVFIVAIVVDTIQAFVAMGIGGGLAALFAPKRAPAPVPVTVPQSYMHAPGAAYPYGYGAPPSTPMYPPQPGAPSAPSAYPGYPAYPSAPSTPVYPAPPAAPGATPAYPAYPAYPPSPYGPQQPPPSGAQAPGVYPSGWGAPPAPNPGAPPPAAYPAPQQPPSQQGNQGTS